MIQPHTKILSLQVWLKPPWHKFEISIFTILQSLINKQTKLKIESFFVCHHKLLQVDDNETKEKKRPKLNLNTLNVA